MTVTTSASSCPVCGKAVDIASAPRSTFRGVTYYLRCPGCKARFDADPERFVSMGGGTGGCCGAGHGEGHCLNDGKAGHSCEHREPAAPARPAHRTAHGP